MEERKGIGQILSEALDVISENPLVIVPYIIPIVLALIAAFVAFGVFVSQAGPFPFTDFEPDPEFIMNNVLGFLGLASIFGILELIFTVLAAAFAIVITFNAKQGKIVSLGEAWSEIGVGKLIILLITWLIATILTALGLIALCIGALIVYILLIFVYQGILIDKLDIGATFSNSYNIAKDNFFDILILVLIFGALILLISAIPYIGGVLAVFVRMYAVVAYTILYLNRK
jgi:hypothetical protein